MGFNFAKAKASARRVVHSTFGVAVSYEDASVSISADKGLTARWHNKQTLEVAAGGEDYTQHLEGIDRIVFLTEQLAEFGLAPVTNAVISFPDYGLRFRLLEREPRTTGPIEEIWKVAVV
ncbi:hypothetical protein XccvBFoX4_gp23 [Xanthomonas phage FoX4]|uniref:Uncharacterized protein n=1 Tax=Xanthomonas phage FoX4 TaxID=2723900 RepID=A0A858WLX5_9CAUD|nr:hypothetical protein KNU97_gp23 [Xanthomonas phage FoX4]QJI52977.1 hypothetical protein XccvBFoX4_gp23 [Xanthomonas phage FoX4]